MPQIGTFTRTATGFPGRIRTLSFDTEFVIVSAEPAAAENTPDFRIHLGDGNGPEVGAGWTRHGERAGEFVAIVLDDPVFLAPIRARLFRDTDDEAVWSLHWTRLSRRSERD